MTAYGADPRIGLALLAVVAIVYLYERFQPDAPDATSLEGLIELHSRGEISDAKFNRRREVLLYDEQPNGAFSWLQEIDGIGPELAFAIAAEFPTIGALRAASRADLEAIHNVGESTAGAIVRRLEDEEPVYA